MPVEHVKIIDKLYDPETGDGALELTKRADGKFDLVIYRNNDDITLYGLTRKELIHVQHTLQGITSTPTGPARDYFLEARGAERAFNALQTAIESEGYEVLHDISDDTYSVRRRETED